MGSNDALGRFTDLQRTYWQNADAEHFRWQTQNAYISRTEVALLAGIDLRPRDRVLEIGCGEGSNLHHLSARCRGAILFAVDLSLPKVAFAIAATRALAATADAASLPFGTGAFDVVLVRDLLHHVADPQAVLAEAVRVLKPGGRIVVIEPNGRNPIIVAMALIIRAERGMLASTPARAESELRACGVGELSVEHRQAMPLSRVLLHYRLGLPSLAGNGVASRLLASAERTAELLPHSMWAYFVIRGVAPGSINAPAQTS